jgi:hypothetical protein
VIENALAGSDRAVAAPGARGVGALHALRREAAIVFEQRRQVREARRRHHAELASIQRDALQAGVGEGHERRADLELGRTRIHAHAAHVGVALRVEVPNLPD